MEYISYLDHDVSPDNCNTQSFVQSIFSRYFEYLNAHYSLSLISSVVRRSCAAARGPLPSLVPPPLANPLVDLGLALQPLHDLDHRLLVASSITGFGSDV